MTQLEIDGLYSHIGGRIRTIRKKFGLNQEKFAEKVGLSRVSIVNIEKGKQHPTVHFLYLVSKEFKVDIGDIYPTSFSNLERKAKNLELPDKDKRALLEMIQKLT
ncbi:MAG: helix-turn-helix transcriptional regulator [Cyclobacteriaceae bacterium]